MTALQRLSLTNFRSHAALTLDVTQSAVCLYGPNGAGKTNILEALSLLGPGRGLRSAPIPELARKDGPGGWTISAVLDNDVRIGVGFGQTAGAAKRDIRIDGAAATAADLAEWVRIVWLTPAMDGVFRGGAADRRRFFDRQVMAHRTDHGRQATRYEKAMRERNALFERAQVDPLWADAIELRMAEAAAHLAINRAEILVQLQTAVDQRPEGPFPKGDLRLDGALETAASGGAAFAELVDQSLQELRQGRRRDQAAGRTLFGPHRTDLKVVHRPTGAPAGDASTGQQKALLIGLILANARALQHRAGGPGPLILLDEAAAHLDQNRRAALFEELTSLGGQAWLTGTEAFLFEPFSDRAQLIEVGEATSQEE
ncbi:MAG: DNA replication/repair protein RecF [Pseudomonadota bacterium]